MAVELTNKVVAEVRENFGKGFARRMRAAGQIPAVIYGHGSEARHVALPGHQIMLLLRRANALLELNINGTSELVLVKDVQRDPVRQIIEHLDLLVIKTGERVEVEVPVVIEGESYPGTIVNHETSTIRLEALATAIPSSVVVSVQGMVEGTVITAADLVLPEGSTLADEPEMQIASILTPAVAPEPSEDDEAAE